MKVCSAGCKVVTLRRTNGPDGCSGNPSVHQRPHGITWRPTGATRVRPHSPLRLVSDRSPRMALLPHLVAKRYHPARVRFHLHEVQGDILVEPVEEWDPFTDQDRHDRIANFVSQSEPKAFTRDGAPSDEPDATERRFQPLMHQVREIASSRTRPYPWSSATRDGSGRTSACRHRTNRIPWPRSPMRSRRCASP